MPDMFDTPISTGARLHTPTPLAGAGARLVARVIDGVLVTCALMPSVALVLALGGGAALAGRPGLQLVTLLPAVALLFVLSLYQWFSTATDGTTIGKRLMGIRIERDDGKRPGFVSGVVIRGWVFTFGSLFLTVTTCVGGGVLWTADGLMVFGQDRKCLHDRLAGTRVVSDE